MSTITSALSAALLKYADCLLRTGSGAHLAEPESELTRILHTSDWTEHVHLGDAGEDGDVYMDTVDFYVHNLDGSTRAAYRVTPITSAVEELPT